MPKQPTRQEKGDMAKLMVTLVVQGFMCLAPSLTTGFPLPGIRSTEKNGLGTYPGVTGKRVEVARPLDEKASMEKGKKCVS